MSNTATAFEVHVPGLGESITEATIAKWVKADGDAVGSEDVIAELETDKATVELSPVQAGMAAGKKGVLRVKAQKGKTVNVGDVIAVIEEGQGAPAQPAGQTGAQAAGQGKKDEPARVVGPSGAVLAKDETKANLELPLSPAVRVMVEENKLDPAKIPATGRDGRITKEDVQQYISTTGPTQGSDSHAANQSRDARSGQTQQGATTAGTTTQPVRDKQASPAPAPAAPALKLVPSTEEDTREPMSKLRQTIARRLVEAQHTAAMLTTFNEVDMTAVMGLREKYKEGFEKANKVKLGFMSFFAKACVAALRAVPAVNAQIDGTDVIYRKSVHMGIAVSTPRGLVVPVLRYADQMSMAQIESEIVRLATKARDGKLSVEEMSGGTFTVTNGGTFGSLLSTPILNPPQSGILGMHKIEKRAVVVDDQIVIRPMMYLALSYDHRIIDGAQAVTFLVKVKEALEDPARMVLGV